MDRTDDAAELDAVFLALVPLLLERVDRIDETAELDLVFLLGNSVASERIFSPSSTFCLFSIGGLPPIFRFTPGLVRRGASKLLWSAAERVEITL